MTKIEKINQKSILESGAPKESTPIEEPKERMFHSAGCEVNRE